LDCIFYEEAIIGVGCIFGIVVEVSAQTKIILVISISIIIIVVVWIFYTNTRTVISCKDLSPKPSIIVLGDSLVEGLGARAGEDFVSVLSGKIGIPIKNLGVSGDTTKQGLKRAQEITEMPDIVIILIGGNDALRKTPVTETKANLEKIIKLFKTGENNTTHVILVGVLGGFPRDTLKTMYEELEEEQDVTYVPNILSGLFGRSEFMADAIHPNASGYIKIAERIYPVLEKECATLVKK